MALLRLSNLIDFPLQRHVIFITALLASSLSGSSFALRERQTCMVNSNCGSGLHCETCLANGNVRPRCTRIQPLNPISKCCFIAMEDHSTNPGDLHTPTVDVPTSSHLTASKQSEVWKHFKKTNIDGKGVRAICLYCKNDYACDSNKNGTSTLNRHIREFCSASPFRTDNKQKILSFDSKSSVVARPFNADRSRRACAEMLIMDELPFSHVEAMGFRHFMREAQPRFDPPSRRTVARDIWNIYREGKKKLKSYISKKNQMVSLTTDTWTSIQNINYMAVTAHFIDDSWTLHKRIINFFPITNHTGEAIGRKLEKSLRDWSIEKVFCITLDNASSNQVVIRHMTRKLNSWNSLVLGGEFLHMRCCAHITNLIVCDGMVELHSSIKNIRRACKYTRSSPSRLARFRRCIASEKIESKGLLPLECKTRWNSIYLLLASALKLQKAFDRLSEEDEEYVGYFKNKKSQEDYDDLRRKKRKRFEGELSEVTYPTSQDWLNAEAFVKFLKRFYDATLKFSAHKKVTINAPFQEMISIVRELKSVIRNGNEFMQRVATSMKLKFDKYWGSVKEMNQLILIAVILDPRYKMEYVTYGLEFLVEDNSTIGEVTRGLQSLLMSLYEAYKIQYPEVFEVNSGIEDDERIDDEEDPMLLGFMRRKKEKDVMHINNEVDKYMMEASENPLNLGFNVLQWWKGNASRFPILSMIAKDVFAVPVSSVASEAAFSAGKRVVDPFRASLTPKTVEALICSNDWLKGEAFDFHKVPTEEDIEFYTILEKMEKEIEMELSDIDEADDEGLNI